MCVIQIGQEDGDFLAIKLLGRSHPSCTDYWDGNWLNADVALAAGGFRGSISGYLRAEEFVDFCQQMASLQGSQSRVANFVTMEEWLSVCVIDRGRGHMKVECVIMDKPGVGNRLIFELALDQTLIPAYLSQLRLALKEYQVIGEPPE